MHERLKAARSKDGLRLKTPKTHRSRRSIVLPAMTTAALCLHRAKQAEERLALGPAYEDEGFGLRQRPGSGRATCRASDALAGLSTSLVPTRMAILEPSRTLSSEAHTRR